MARRTLGPVTIDEPIKVLGLLEIPDDLVLLAVVTGALLFFIPIYLAGFVGMGLSFLMGKLKADKPRGYVSHLLIRGFSMKVGNLPKAGRYRV